MHADAHICIFSLTHKWIYSACRSLSLCFICTLGKQMNRLHSHEISSSTVCLCSGCACLCVCVYVFKAFTQCFKASRALCPQDAKFWTQLLSCVCMCVILTMLLGQLTQCWTLLEPTSHDATLLVTSHGFSQFLPSFSIAGTKIHSDWYTHTHTHNAEMLTQTHTSLCLPCLLSFCKWQRTLSGCLVTVLVYPSSLALLLLQLLFSISLLLPRSLFFQNKPPLWESLS